MREPVVVDNTLHKAFTVTYAIYIATAIIAAFSFPPSLEAVGGVDITRIWFLGLGGTSLFSLVFSLQEKHQRKEMVSTGLLLAFLAAYPIALGINAGAKWNADLLMVATFTLSFIPLPAWRVLFFFKKYRKPRG